uniref:Crustacean-hyperglycemic-hormone-3 n=1 Tax=Gecarcinus lateralis TaxID=6769 RepID=A0AA50EXX6_GECLA|nr:crustacean-hyperglycemic-hormone-3 [Gecarcinus lateralis]
MAGRTATLTTAVVTVVVVVTLVGPLFVSPASAGPVESLTSRLNPLAQLPEDSSKGNPKSVEAKQQQWHHRLTKRSYVDSSCKGLYSRSVWDKLYYVCDDCQNLFRDADVGKECRRGCFASDTFVMCLGNLLMPVDQYLTMATSLRGS